VFKSRVTQSPLATSHSHLCSNHASRKALCHPIYCVEFFILFLNLSCCPFYSVQSKLRQVEHEQAVAEALRTTVDTEKADKTDLLNGLNRERSLVTDLKDALFREKSRISDLGVALEKERIQTSTFK
jgi:hypothetical protein